MFRKFHFPLAFALALSPGTLCASDQLDQGRLHEEYKEGNFEAVVRDIDTFRKANPSHSRSDSIFIAKHLAVVYAANPMTVEIGKYWMHQMLRLMPEADLAEMYVNEEIDRIYYKIFTEFKTRQQAFGVDTGNLAMPSRKRKDSTGAKPDSESLAFLSAPDPVRDTTRDAIAPAPVQASPTPATVATAAPAPATSATEETAATGISTSTSATAAAPNTDNVRKPAPMPPEKGGSGHKAYWFGGAAAIALAGATTAYFILNEDDGTGVTRKRYTVPKEMAEGQ